eukprot:922913-Prorocentrum_minimum.AAC.1
MGLSYGSEREVEGVNPRVQHCTLGPSYRPEWEVPNKHGPLGTLILYLSLSDGVWTPWRGYLMGLSYFPEWEVEGVDPQEAAYKVVVKEGHVQLPRRRRRHQAPGHHVQQHLRPDAVDLHMPSDPTHGVLHHCHVPGPGAEARALSSERSKKKKHAQVGEYICRTHLRASTVLSNRHRNTNSQLNSPNLLSRIK